MKHIKSGIPQDVIERPVREPNETDRHHTVNCYFEDELVGQRVYNREGILILETPMKDGLKHGREMSWNDDGTLLLVEPYRKGKVHGTARQYGQNGKAIGTYTMVRGTGLDVWRQEDEAGGVFVAGIHNIQDGLPNGYEWRFASSKEDLWQERHWMMGKVHGIERVWNNKGKLRRGYPKFFVRDQAVPKQKYIKATSTDTTLPAFREEDNLPYRKFPDEIKRILRS